MFPRLLFATPLPPDLAVFFLPGFPSTIEKKARLYERYNEH